MPFEPGQFRAQTSCDSAVFLQPRRTGHVSMKFRRAVVDCSQPEWARAAHTNLFDGVELDLVNFDYEQHGRSCELMAQAFSMDFTLDRDPTSNTAHFRNRGHDR